MLIGICLRKIYFDLNKSYDSCHGLLCSHCLKMKEIDILAVVVPTILLEMYCVLQFVNEEEIISISMLEHTVLIVFEIMLFHCFLRRRVIQNNFDIKGFMTFR